MKRYRNLIGAVLLSLSLFTLFSCGPKRPIEYSYSFEIVDSITGENLVGDTLFPLVYDCDSISYHSIIGNIVDTIYNYTYLDFKLSTIIPWKKEYYFTSSSTAYSDRKFLLKYNSVEKDTIRIVYGRDNIIVYQNNQLIYSRDYISQMDDINFQIKK